MARCCCCPAAGTATPPCCCCPGTMPPGCKRSWPGRGRRLTLISGKPDRIPAFAARKLRHARTRPQPRLADYPVPGKPRQTAVTFPRCTPESDHDPCLARIKNARPSPDQKKLSGIGLWQQQLGFVVVSQATTALPI